MRVTLLHKGVCFILALSFGLMSFALPGNHFTHKSIWGIDHLSLEPDVTALSGYSTDGFLLGHILDMLAGIDDDTNTDGQPAKNFNYHYSFFNLQKSVQSTFIDTRINKQYLYIPTFCLNDIQHAGAVEIDHTPLPTYYTFLFRLTPF